MVLAALSICLCACAPAVAAGRHKHHKHPPGAHQTGAHKARGHRSSRAARCRRYARKHPGTRCHARKHHAGGHHGVSGDHRQHRPRSARAGSCPGADLKPDAQNLERIRSATLCLINDQRAAHGLHALQVNDKLQQAAQAHTSEMAFGNYFDHTGPHGDTPLSRMRASGYIYSSRIGYEIGENIAWGTLGLATPRAIVHAWINSPEHLANILNGHYRDTAIGVSAHAPGSLSKGQSGGIYTEDFGVIITG